MVDRETPRDWAALFGVSWNANDPEISDYSSALAANQASPIHGFSIGNTDSGYQGHDLTSWTALGMVMLQQRKLLYLRRTPGDCNGFNGNKLPASTGQLGLATVSSSVAALASGGTNIGADISSVVNQIKLVLSVFTGADLEILQERNIWCPISIQLSNAMASLDTAASASGANIAGILSQFENMISQAVALATKAIALQQGAGYNTSGCFCKWMEAHYTFRTLWYPKLAGGVAGGVGSTALLAGGGLIAAKVAGLI